MAVVISEAVVVGDTSVAAEPKAGALTLSGQSAEAGIGVSPAAGAGGMDLSGKSAEVGVGVSSGPKPGAMSFTGQDAAQSIGIAASPGHGELAFNGATPISIARGRIVVVSSEMVVVAPRPRACVEATFDDSAELRAVDAGSVTIDAADAHDVTTTANYQKEDC
ncbi:MAG: hypothetical protein ACOC7J_05510 [Armatimonadota bacterium]